MDFGSIISFTVLQITTTASNKPMRNMQHSVALVKSVDTAVYNRLVWTERWRASRWVFICVCSVARVSLQVDN